MNSQSLPAVDLINYSPRQGSENDGVFTLQSGHPVDYACFALWNGALSRQCEILDDLKQQFQVVGDFEITWSRQHYNRNIARLYERRGGLGAFEGWNDKIGPPPFRFIVVRDPAPICTWKRSVSGVIEPSNEKVVAAKYKYRDMFQKPYQVHSSNNLLEFLYQSVLVLGKERLERVVGADCIVSETLQKDLEGADGWRDWNELFSVLSASLRYLVLRNFESLPNQLDDKDIDFLCDDCQRFASVANIEQRSSRRYKGSLRVDGKSIASDIRFVGDGYYPAVWEQDMLRSRSMFRSFYVPNTDDLFFSILYHCKVQKPQVKPKYRTELQALAVKMRFDWFDVERLDDDTACGKLLAGYLRSRNLHFEVPIDAGVFCNHSIVGQLPQRDGKRRNLKQKVSYAIRNPDRILPFLIRKLTKKP